MLKRNLSDAKIHKKMNTLPAAFEERIQARLGREAEAFFKALQAPSPVSIRLHPGKVSSPEGLFPANRITGKVVWCNHGLYLSERPVFTLDPFFHGGAYYVQEASSMFLHHLLKQLLPSTPIRMLDLCAAPGGKSTLAASLLPAGSLLISNEVIRSRASVLKENIIKWGTDHIVITNNDPADFRPLTGAFDIILVDAPCSGEGMFRKDPEAIHEWSAGNLQLCSDRQQRILTDIWDCLKPGGYLIYSTCTYNTGENEAILEWLHRTYQAAPVPIEHNFPGITPAYSDLPGYRFYPHKIQGEGFFIGVVRKTEGKEFNFRKNKRKEHTKPIALPASLKPYLLRPELCQPYADGNILGIIPQTHADFINNLTHTLRILYKGCELAEFNNQKLKLLPPSALWQGLNRNHCNLYPADRNTALAFLKKEDIPLTGKSGEWVLVTYGDIALGWCKNLGNRMNNYYPKEWRIRMSLDHPGDRQNI